MNALEGSAPDFAIDPSAVGDGITTGKCRHELFDTGEIAGREGGTDRTQEVSDHACNSLRFQPIKYPIPFPALRNQVRALKDGKVAGDGRPRDGKAGTDLARSQLACFEFLQYLPARRVGRAEDTGCRFYVPILAILLTSLNRKNDEVE
jgi:hypothetical protein